MMPPMPLLYNRHQFGNLYTNMRAHKRRQVCGKCEMQNYSNTILSYVPCYRCSAFTGGCSCSQVFIAKRNRSFAEQPAGRTSLGGEVVNEALSIVVRRLGTCISKMPSFERGYIYCDTIISYKHSKSTLKHLLRQTAM